MKNLFVVGILAGLTVIGISSAHAFDYTTFVVDFTTPAEPNFGTGLSETVTGTISILSNVQGPVLPADIGSFTLNSTPDDSYGFTSIGAYPSGVAGIGGNSTPTGFVVSAADLLWSPDSSHVGSNYNDNGVSLANLTFAGYGFVNFGGSNVLTIYGQSSPTPEDDEPALEQFPMALGVVGTALAIPAPEIDPAGATAALTLLLGVLATLLGKRQRPLQG